jgi:methylated-DNA-[protein]-cysteine S-methyltransferase
MNESITLETLDTPIGCVSVSAGDYGLIQVDLFGFKSTRQPAHSDQQPSEPALKIARQALDEIQAYLHGNLKVFTVLLDRSRMTPFQKRVLDITYSIPFGEFRTYGQIAQLLGNPNASRAVGTALGRNPLPIIIPCHRVVASTGWLTGYSAADGIRTKQWLLELEGHKIVDQKLV